MIKAIQKYFHFHIENAIILILVFLCSKKNKEKGGPQKQVKIIIHFTKKFKIALVVIIILIKFITGIIKFFQ